MVTASFLYLCSGYYNYDEGFTPDFPGLEDFEGEIVHPQFWTEDVDYDGKEVVVIGSGATAVTLIPSMADRTKHVTMLQRSPTYITSLPARRPDRLLPAQGAAPRPGPPADPAEERRDRHRLLRVLPAVPEARAQVPDRRARRALPDDFDTKHLKPKYNPWDQRLCIVPNGDLWRTLKSGKASIATDQIARFTKDRHRPGVGRTTSPPTWSSPPRASRWWRSARSSGGRRSQDRLARGLRLQGHDVQRHPELRLVRRLHQRVVDAARRPDLEVRLPAHQPHGRERLRLRHARPGRGRGRLGAAAQPAVGLCAARGRDPAAAGHDLTVDDPAELVPRLLGQPPQRPRRGHGLDSGSARSLGRAELPLAAAGTRTCCGA